MSSHNDRIREENKKNQMEEGEMTKERFIIGVDVGKDTIAVTVKEKGKGKRASVNPMQIDRDNIAEKIEIDTRHCEPPCCER